MKSVYSFIVIALLVVAAHAQTAKVVQLTPEEAKQAKALYAEQADVIAKINTLRENISKNHLPIPTSSTDGFAQGPWLLGFEFSDDYRFIVPVQPSQGAFQYGVTGGCSTPIYGTSTPVYGTQLAIPLN